MLQSLSCPANTLQHLHRRLEPRQQSPTTTTSTCKPHHDVLAQRPTHGAGPEPEPDEQRHQGRRACACIETRPRPETQETVRYVRVCCCCGEMQTMRCTQLLQPGIQWCRWWGGFYFWQTFRFQRREQGTRNTGDTGDTGRGPSTDGGPKEGPQCRTRGSAGAPSSTVRPAAAQANHTAPRIASSFASHRPKKNAGLVHAR